MMMMYGLLALVLPLVVSSAPLYVRVLPQDCDEIYSSGTRLSGVYTIYPSGPTPVDVFCEMHCDDDQTGGWTVFQRRMDGSVNFYKPWAPYRNGFGNRTGEYWLGLENLYLLTHRRNYQLRVDLEDFEGLKSYALYTSFSVDSEATGYMLHVSGFVNGGAGDGLSYHNGQMFSTFNNDQDHAENYNLARSYLGYTANPKGIYLQGRDDTFSSIGNTWKPWRGDDYGLKYICMKFKLVP